MRSWFSRMTSPLGIYGRDDSRRACAQHAAARRRRAMRSDAGQLTREIFDGSNDDVVLTARIERERRNEPDRIPYRVSLPATAGRSAPGVRRAFCRDAQDNGPLVRREVQLRKRRQVAPRQASDLYDRLPEGPSCRGGSPGRKLRWRTGTCGDRGRQRNGSHAERHAQPSEWLSAPSCQLPASRS